MYDTKRKTKAKLMSPYLIEITRGEPVLMYPLEFIQVILYVHFLAKISYDLLCCFVIWWGREWEGYIIRLKRVSIGYSLMLDSYEPSLALDVYNDSNIRTVYSIDTLRKFQSTDKTH